MIIAVFIAGLMIGRTPEYLGKKIEAFEMKMASLMVLIPVMAVLLGTALAVSIPEAKQAVFNPGAHGFSEVLYAFSSASNNNGSAFAGLGTNTPFYNIALAIAMLLGRFWLAIPVLAIAGSLVAQEKSAGDIGDASDLHTFIYKLAHHGRHYSGSIELLPGPVAGAAGGAALIEVITDVDTTRSDRQETLKRSPN